MLNKLANFALSVTKSSFTFIEILPLVRKPLLVRNGLTAFHNFFLFHKTTFSYPFEKVLFCYSCKIITVVFALS